MSRTVKIYSIILTFFFLIWILIPFFNDVFQFYSEPTVSKTENRTITRKPLVNFNLLDPYPVSYEKYFKDHFIFRPQALQAHSYLNFYYFRRSPIPNRMDIGKHLWLFNGEDDKLIYQGKKTISNDSIMMIVRELHKRTLYLRGKGIHFYVCFAPMTQEIYPEFLPNNYFRSPGGTQTDKVIAAIHRDTVIQFIDLKPKLIAAKKYGRLYQTTDNHWNYLGAFFAYSAIIERMKKDFPVLKPLMMSDITFKQQIRKGGGLANMMGFDSILMENDFSPEIRNARGRLGAKAGYPPPWWFPYKDEYEVVSVLPDQNLPKLFVIRDSFFNFPMLYMRENFSKTTAIWDGWMYKSNKVLIEKEKPDIVLLIILEPLIGHVVNGPSD